MLVKLMLCNFGSMAMHCSRFEGRLKDIVYWRGVSGVTEVGEAFSFYELCFTCRESRFLAEVILFLRASPTSWKKNANCAHKLINLADLRTVPSCLDDGNCVQPRFVSHRFASFDLGNPVGPSAVM